MWSTGCCVPARELDKIAVWTAALLQDPARMQKLGAAGRNLVRERFDKDRMAEILLQDYLRILAEKKERTHVR